MFFRKENNTKRDIKLYNAMFPIWILMMFPVSWLFVIPANYVIDSLVLFLGLILMRRDEKLEFYKKTVIWVFLFGFLADILGGSLLLITQFFGEKGFFYEYFTAPIAQNPFDNVWSMLYTIFAVIVSGVLIYIFNRFISFRKIKDKKLKQVLAILLAVLTAPYIFLIPSTTLYGGETECFTNHIVWSDYVQAAVYDNDAPTTNIMEDDAGRPHSYVLINVLREGINTADESDKKLSGDWDFKVIFAKGGDMAVKLDEICFYFEGDKLYFKWKNEAYLVDKDDAESILTEYESHLDIINGKTEA